MHFDMFSLQRTKDESWRITTLKDLAKHENPELFEKKK